MNKLYLLLITLLFSLCLCASEAESNQKIDVTKEYTEENGLYRFTVKYKKGANVVGLITQVSIWDSLPEYLELTEGVLVKKLPNAGDNWETNEYVARLVDYEFTLDNRTLTYHSRDFFWCEYLFLSFNFNLNKWFIVSI
eukprot:TRINITY_DN7124_c0_g1_i3.p1 TRINITY_DN7124_c0_g1~~TRINITY_DN7124_c0_g1_i3.p1  ORF type:complete len:139 (-),score=24.18 TRINITY_DN7124_c0_g1_i3:25-441(-)